MREIIRRSFSLPVVLVIFSLAPGLLAGCGADAMPPAAPEETEVQGQEEAPSGEDSESGDRLILATTTSTEDSGLLSVLIPQFEEEHGIDVDVVAVGTGQALQLGEDGNADVLLVHDRAREDAFMEAGHGVRREDVMYNDFVIVGPEADPAAVQEAEDATAAFTQVADAEATFISRGDDSGTHGKELSIWEAAGIEPQGEWYVAAGQGMGAVLTIADEQLAYTLSDRATYLARTLEGTELVIVHEGDPLLFNPYGVMAVNPDKGDHIQAEAANTFIEWIISVPVQETISTLGEEEFGQPLFVPDSEAWNEAGGSDG
ncbi:MAG: substrate-binding domain-containing protein [Chloroflexota bacterium]